MRKFNNHFFSKNEYLKNFSKEYGQLTYEGVSVSYYIVRKGIFSKLVFTSPILSSFGNPIDIKGNEHTVHKIIEHARMLNVDYIAQPMAHVYFDMIPKGAIGVKWSSPIVSLSGTDDEILARMHKKHRNVIRKAEKTGISVNFNAQLEDVHSLIKETMDKQGRAAVSKSLLENLRRDCTEQVMFVSCHFGNEIQGVAVVPFDANSGYYLYGGSCDKTQPGALNYMHYRIMLELRAKGIENYDLMGYRLGGTSDEKIIGIQRFKMRFGAELSDGMTWKYVLNKKKYAFQSFIFKVQGFFKGKPFCGDVIDQGNSFNE
jgi:hypothetical protein